MNERIAASAGKIVAGDHSRLHRRLAGHAIVLDAIFAGLSERAIARINENLPEGHATMQIALTAQVQYCATVEALAAIKTSRSDRVGGNRPGRKA
ncbi:hypothetical protein QEV83_01580 [Methylocapsa sp. D3K7]|uniref:hypothetical protein n=1 Tax=Methylocapsa sp. D3K7 TaxID=3041435 RepID=UPI00244E7A72|nr:hypothetical protein [Methylocapsa sp. D3K7]WGJ15027.1 hypothetical protein QEV83_01580 [Methylocapsa sp. D3K7]